MNSKNLFLVTVLLLLLYPVISAINLDLAISTFTNQERVANSVRNYQISIWVTWIVLVIVAIIYKWTTRENFFFYIIYSFLLVAFGVLGYYLQEMITLFDITTRFQDSSTYGVFTALLNLVVSVLLTAFLQVGVWWFTRRWHRR